MKFFIESDIDISDDEIDAANTNIDSFGILTSVSKVEDEKAENLNRQGLIRTVKDAHLVYKRENETDRYNELWIFKAKMHGVYQDIDIKADILAGTDIPLNSNTSLDGEQTFNIWYSGNMVFLEIVNLPN